MKKQGTAIRAIPLDIDHPKGGSSAKKPGKCIVITKKLRSNLK
jgi:hypothetical protein